MENRFIFSLPRLGFMDNRNFLFPGDKVIKGSRSLHRNFAMGICGKTTNHKNTEGMEFFTSAISVRSVVKSKERPVQ